MIYEKYYKGKRILTIKRNELTIKSKQALKGKITGNQLVISYTNLVRLIQHYKRRDTKGYFLFFYSCSNSSLLITCVSQVRPSTWFRQRYFYKKNYFHISKKSPTSSKN